MEFFGDQPIDGFLQKPFTAQALAQAIEGALRSG
jgi:FixJ family two-component response regulator